MYALFYSFPQKVIQERQTYRRKCEVLNECQLSHPPLPHTISVLVLLESPFDSPLLQVSCVSQPCSSHG